VRNLAAAKKGEFVDLLTMQRWAGIYYYIAKFVDNGRARCNEIFSLLVPKKIAGRNVCRITSKAICDMDALLQEITSGYRRANLVDNPSYETKGLSAFTADAAGSFECPKAGWGVSAMCRISASPWSSLTKTAINKQKIFIPQLELLAVAILILIMRPSLKGASSNRIIVYTDSESAVPVINSGRTKSATMAKALEIFNRACKKENVEILAVHTPGKLNVIADALSRGEYQTAERKTKSLFGPPIWVPPPAEAGAWEKELVIFALNSRSANERNSSPAQK